MKFWGTFLYFSGFLAVLAVVFIAIDPNELILSTPRSKPQKIAIQVPQDLKAPEIVDRTQALNSSDLLKPEPMAMSVESFKTFQGTGAASGFSALDGEPTQALLNEIRNQSRPAQVSQRKAPQYPDQAKRQNLEGYVVVKILVGASGEFVKSEVLESVPKGVFDRSVLDSLSNWKFVPGLQQGQRISMWITQKVRFQVD